jgi:DNA polymerase-3 subunit delta'
MQSISEILTQSVLKKREPSHAYLFFGPQSSKKEEKAIQFSASLLCKNEGIEACGICLSCKKIKSGNHPDFRLIAPDGDKIKIAQIRALKEEIGYPPLESSWKIYLFLKSESMTEEAAQSLLKILEEPPPAMILILLAPHPSSILPTLASRCQWIPTNPPLPQERQEYFLSKGVLKEHACALAFLDVPEEELAAWKRILKEIPPTFFSPIKTPFQLFEKVSLLEDYKGNAEILTSLLLAFFRDVMALKAGWTEGIIFPPFQEMAKKYADTWSWWELWKKIQAVLEAREFLEKSGNFHLVFDTLLFKIFT